MNDFNAEIAHKALEAIRLDPTSHHQDVWRCDTGQCFAGWVAVEAGLAWGSLSIDGILGHHIVLRDGWLEEKGYTANGATEPSAWLAGLSVEAASYQQWTNGKDTAVGVVTIHDHQRLAEWYLKRTGDTYVLPVDSHGKPLQGKQLMFVSEYARIELGLDPGMSGFLFAPENTREILEKYVKALESGDKKLFAEARDEASSIEYEVDDDFI